MRAWRGGADAYSAWTREYVACARTSGDHRDRYGTSVRFRTGQTSGYINAHATTSDAAQTAVTFLCCSFSTLERASLIPTLLSVRSFLLGPLTRWIMNLACATAQRHRLIDKKIVRGAED